MTDLLVRAEQIEAMTTVGEILGLLIAAPQPLPGVDYEPFPGFQLSSGVNVILIPHGLFVIEYPTFDGGGNELTPINVDNDHLYANVRLTGEALENDLIPNPVDPLDIHETSVVGKSFKDNGSNNSQPSLFPGGPNRNRYVRNIGPFGPIELIWPLPLFQRNGWA